ncbi:hypothetical protein J7E96_05515 [Streptomyces sp. ISL-96]|uniref:LppU/SCO3897 family protein n=1 Tax=Streptomyces sp. ISL-96 TaxID=2819191 RepID=UPI001BEB9817|nr:hypothetical protein [Streptomyces sp. ISL-96]MBT2488000.1 hypothetical protein [Streptomyces sp. ISL-96]
MSTPPPQGGYNPYPQQQGQPPYGQQPYQGQPQSPYGAPGGQPPQPPRRNRGLSPVIKGASFVVAAIVVLIYVFFFKDHSTTTPVPDATPDTTAYSADVGDCVMEKGTEARPDIEIVDCAGPKAELKVTEEGMSVDTLECKPGESKFTITQRGRIDVALCLEPLKK